MRSPFPALVFTLILASPLFAADGDVVTPYLVRNINTQPIQVTQTVNLFGAEVFGDDVFYRNSNTRLFHTNGNRIGNYAIADGGDAHAKTLRAGDGTVFFRGPDSYYQSVKLWATDGTTAGTRSLMTLPDFYGAARCGNLFCVSAGYNLLAATDGTPAGSSFIASTDDYVEVVDIPYMLRTVGSKSLFTGYDSDHGRCVYTAYETFCGELWTSDGTAAGTRMLIDIYPGAIPSAPKDLYSYGGKLYFVARSPNNGPRTMYVSDGTAEGTRRLFPDRAQPTSNGPVIYVDGGQFLYLRPFDLQWFRTDGTPEGTKSIAELAGVSAPAYVDGVAASPDGALFTATHSLSITSVELWAWIGNRGYKLRDAPTSLRILGWWEKTKRFYFTVVEQGDTKETLYATDGTAAGTVAVATIPSDAALSWLPAQSHAYFMTGSFVLWQTDGTAAGTHPVENSVRHDGGSTPTELTSAGGLAWFLATGDDGQRRLFATDGTADGTRAFGECATCSRLQEDAGVLTFRRDGAIWTVAADGSARSLESSISIDRYIRTLPVAMGGAEYFIAEPIEGGASELWQRRDGKSHLVGAFPSRLGYEPRIIAGSRLFISADGTLFVSDGASEPTRVKKADGSSNVRVAGNLAFFDTANGSPYVTDGTDAGTRKLPVELAFNNYARSLAVWHDALFIRASGLWRSDGTAEGTTQLSADYSLSDAQVVQTPTELLLIGFGGDRKFEVWSTDGTPENTKRRLTLPNVQYVSAPVHTSGGDDYLPFLALAPQEDPMRGYGLLNLHTGAVRLFAQKSISSPLVGAIYFTSSSPQHFAAAGDRIIFAGEHPRIGVELWAVDPTDETEIVAPAISVEWIGNTDVAGAPAAVFEISIDGAAAASSVVSYETVDGSAHAASDFTAVRGTLMLDEEPTRTLVIPYSPEAVGTFSVMLTNPSNAVLRTSIATASVAPRSLRKRVAPR